MELSEFLVLLEKLRTGYNQLDFTAFDAIIAEDVKWEHRNHWMAEGRAEMIRMMKDFHAKMPVRYFGDIGRSAVNGNLGVVEQKWHVMPVADEPAWGAKKDVLFTMDMCSVFVLEGGKIVEWNDFA